MTKAKFSNANHLQVGRIITLGLVLTLGLMLLLPGTAYTDENALSLIKDLSEEVLTRMYDDAEEIRSQPTSLLQIIEDTLLPHFDSGTTARQVLDQHWGDATLEQRAQFTQEFREYLARFYARVLVTYAGEKIDTTHAPLDVAGDCAERCVESKLIARKSRKEIVIRYYLRKSAGSWMVYDFSIDGVSLVVTNRSQFASLIGRDGLTKVIADLAAHNDRPFR